MCSFCLLGFTNFDMTPFFHTFHVYRVHKNSNWYTDSTWNKKFKDWHESTESRLCLVLPTINSGGHPALFMSRSYALCTDIKNIQICKYKSTKVLILDNIEKMYYPQWTAGASCLIYVAHQAKAMQWARIYKCKSWRMKHKFFKNTERHI